MTKLLPLLLFSALISTGCQEDNSAPPPPAPAKKVASVGIIDFNTIFRVIGLEEKLFNKRTELSKELNKERLKLTKDVEVMIENFGGVEAELTAEQKNEVQKLKVEQAKALAKRSEDAQKTFANLTDHYRRLMRGETQVPIRKVIADRGLDILLFKNVSRPYFVRDEFDITEAVIQELAASQKSAPIPPPPTGNIEPKAGKAEVVPEAAGGIKTDTPEKPAGSLLEVQPKTVPDAKQLTPDTTESTPAAKSPAEETPAAKSNTDKE